MFKLYFANCRLLREQVPMIMLFVTQSIAVCWTNKLMIAMFVMNVNKQEGGTIGKCGECELGENRMCKNIQWKHA